MIESCEKIQGLEVALDAVTSAIEEEGKEMERGEKSEGGEILKRENEREKSKLGRLRKGKQNRVKREMVRKSEIRKDTLMRDR